MLDDDADEVQSAVHMIPHHGEAEPAADMYGTIKREGDASSKQSILQDHNSQQHIVEEVVPIELIIKGKKEKLTDEEIQKLIDENYH